MNWDDFEKRKYIPLSMHSFDNTRNREKMKDNWNILNLFFKKNNDVGNELPFALIDFNRI